MTVLDAYAVIAYLCGERAPGEVRPLLEVGDAVLTAVGVAEVLDHLVRLAGVGEEEAALDLAQLGLLDGLVDAEGIAAVVLPEVSPIPQGRCLDAVTAGL